jgi:transposase InsO family protein
MLHSIVYDRDPTFTSNFWQELFKLQGSQLHLNSTYHPQTNGQMEVVNKCLERYLRCFASKKQH